MDAHRRGKEVWPYDAGQDRRTRRPLEGAGEAEKEDQGVDKGDAYPAAVGRDREDDRAGEGKGLRREDDQFALIGISDRPAYEAERQRRRKANEAEKAQIEDIARNL